MCLIVDWEGEVGHNEQGKHVWCSTHFVKLAWQIEWFLQRESRLAETPKSLPHREPDDSDSVWA